MKKYLLLAVILYSNFLQAQVSKSSFEQLVSVNQLWEKQININAGLKNDYSRELSGRSLLQFHLEQTELLLRSKDISNLSAKLKNQRAKNLDILHGYWQKGIFCVNDKHVNMQPYFIDRYNTYCAVGYLMKMTGGDDIAKDIKATQNYSYLLDIHHPLLMDWVSKSGLSLDELALIQLPYFPDTDCKILEMHYNNSGTDVNEYIEIVKEIHPFSAPLFQVDKVLFYNASNILYKTLLVSQMQTFSANGYQFLHFTFPTNENFADAGRVELVTTSNLIASKTTYDGNSVATQDKYGVNGGNTGGSGGPITTYNFGENESTLISESLQICFQNGSFYLSTLPSSKGLFNSCIALPVSLSKFDYITNNKYVTLSWQTESETNNSYFDVEKSSDGINFQAIGKINSSGNYSTIKQYSFIDENPFYINHYRIKQVDLNGKTAYSKLLFVKINQANPITIKENPVRTDLQIQLNIDESKNNTLSIFDFNGKKILIQKAVRGYQKIDVSKFAAGSYLVQLLTNEGKGYNQIFVKGN